MHIATTPSGNLRVCCNSDDKDKGKNVISKSNGSPYKIYEEKNLKSAWHSSYYRKIRKQMLEGEKPEICTLCFREEEAGLESSRMRSNRKYMFDYESSETPPLNLKFLDLRLGNKCNLRCRMCSPYTSNSLVKEWEELSRQNLSKFITPITGDRVRIKNIANWPVLLDFSKFLDFLPYIEDIYLTGGEPLFIPEYQDLLEYIIQKGFADNIKIRYNTNITKYDVKNLNLWKAFKHVRLSVSIDAFGKLNDYIRYPSKWDLIENNLNQIISLNKQFSNISFVVDCAVQMYNITVMPDFLLWASNKHIELWFNILDRPKFLNIRVLPDLLKQKVKEELLPFKKDFPVKRIIDYMEKESWESYLGDFFRYTDFFDKSRKQNLNDILPELSSYRSV